jgi:hypothetical protein
MNSKSLFPRLKGVRLPQLRGALAQAGLDD